MGPIGIQEMMLIFLVALVLFGPKKLPELGRLLGKGLTEYRRAKNELKSTFETHLRELEREANVNSALNSITSPPATSYSSTSYDEYGHEPSYSDPSPYTGTASNAPDSSTSSTASATATQDAEANRDALSSQTVTPVAGTVPRSNGAHSSVVEPESPANHTTEGHSV